MSDAGHKETDELLEEMEEKLRKEYRQAVKETQAKAEDYFKRFAAKDEKWRARVEAGEVTEKEWLEWRKGQFLVGQRWEEMRDTLAQDYHNANVMARSVVNGYMPEVYALNHNYATFQVEKGSKLDTSYTLYDRQTVERIARDNPEILPPPGKNMKAKIAANKDIAWQEGQIQSATMQAILQGESIDGMAKRICRDLGNTDYASAVRYARTATTGAECAGRRDAYQRAQGMGIPVKQTWVATLDGRTRHSHREMDGETVDVGDSFSNGCEYPGDPAGPPEEVWNCFPGKTKVAPDSEIVRSYRHWYSGDLIEVETTGGVNFSCTPNHPILTPSGWVHANLLHDGDDILVAQISNIDAARVDPDIKHILPSFKAIHQLYSKLPGKRARGLSVDFHGDVATSNVEVISKERLLRKDLNTSGAKSGSKFILKDSVPFILRKSHLVSRLWRVHVTALGLVRSIGKPVPFLWRGLGHSEIHGFRAISYMDTVLPKYTIDDLPAETEIRSELLDGLSGNVLIDHIRSIKIKSFRGHVYNLQTESGYYLAGNILTHDRRRSNGNMIIAKNCRCTTIAQIEGFERDVTDTDLRHNEHLGDMSYDEWKSAHRKGK